jgi:hypothetical protein
LSVEHARVNRERLAPSFALVPREPWAQEIAAFRTHSFEAEVLEVGDLEAKGTRCGTRPLSGALISCLRRCYRNSPAGSRGNWLCEEAALHD